MKKTLSVVLCLLMFFAATFGSLTVSAESCTVAISIVGSGTADPYDNGSVTVESGTAQTFTFTPSEGYYLSEVKWNGVPVAVNSKNQFTTPVIEADAELTVAFAATETTAGIQTFANAFYSGLAKSITFGTLLSLTPATEGLTEYGILCHQTESNVTVDTEGVWKFEAKAATNVKGQFGIELDNSLGVINSTYYTRAYAVYNGETIYAASTLKIDESRYVVPAALEDVSVNTGTLYPEFSPNTHDYYVLLDEIPAEIPTISYTENDGAAVTETVPESLSQPIILSSSANGVTIPYTFSFRMKKTATLNGDYFVHKEYYNTSLSNQASDSGYVGELPYTKRYAPYQGNGERYRSNTQTNTLFHFDSSGIADENIQITDAVLTLYAFSNATSGQTLEILRSADIDWTGEKISKFDEMFPAAGEEGIIGSQRISYSSNAANSSSSYQKYDISLNPSGFTSASSVSLISRAKNDSELDKSIYIWIGSNRSSSAHPEWRPSVSITYFSKEETMKDSNASLSTLSVSDAELWPVFDPETTEYYALYETLPAAVPAVEYTTASSSARAAYTPADSLNGASLVQVTAESGTDSKTYTVKFREKKTAVLNSDFYAIKAWHTTDISNFAYVTSLPYAGHSARPFPDGSGIKSAANVNNKNWNMLHFNTAEISANTQVTAATLQVYLCGASETGTTVKTARLTDTAWPDHLSNYASSYPAVLGEEGDLAVTAVDPKILTSSEPAWSMNYNDCYKQYAIPLKTAGFTNAASVCLMMYSDVSTDATYLYLGKLNGSHNDWLPSVTITYFEK